MATNSKFNVYSSYDRKQSSRINKNAATREGDDNFYKQAMHKQLRQRIESSNNKRLKSEIESIKQNGYIILRNMLSNEELTEIYNESEKHLQKTPFGRNDFEGFSTKRVYCVIAKSRTYDKIITHKRITDILDYFLLPDYILSVSQIIEIAPGETQQAFHRDAGGYFYSKYPRIEYPFRFSTIWALDDFTEKNGATMIIPKSHLISNDINYQQYIASNKDAAIPIIMNRGDCVLFVGGLLHSGGANKSIKSRKGITIQYSEPWLRPQENAQLTVPLDIVPKLSKQLQIMIGYGMYGAYGIVDGVHPIKAIPKLLERYSKL